MLVSQQWTQFHPRTVTELKVAVRFHWKSTWVSRVKASKLVNKQDFVCANDPFSLLLWDHIWESHPPGLHLSWAALREKINTAVALEFQIVITL